MPSIPAQRTIVPETFAIWALWGAAARKVQCSGELSVSLPAAASTDAISTRWLTERLSTRLKYWQSPSWMGASSA